MHICAITAGASSAGILLTMYTDNVINYTMATLSYPCGFYGMMLGLIVGTKMKKKCCLILSIFIVSLLVILVMPWITNKGRGYFLEIPCSLVASHYFYANLHI